jgi:hypothetical protein
MRAAIAIDPPGGFTECQARGQALSPRGRAIAYDEIEACSCGSRDLKGDEVATIDGVGVAIVNSPNAPGAFVTATVFGSSLPIPGEIEGSHERPTRIS